MFIQALLVGLVYYISCFLYLGLGVFHFARPIIVGPLVGLVLGDLTTGVIMGATFESVFLGVIAVGGVRPADETIGAVIGTAIAILTSADTGSALAIAVPVALLGSSLRQVSKAVIIPLFIPVMDKAAANGDQSALKKWHIIAAFVWQLLPASAVFFAIFLGTNSIGVFLDNTPEFLIRGFAASGKMLPAVGFALLLNMLFDKKVFPFFFLGFVLFSYLHLPSIAIAILAVVLALTQFYQNEEKGSKTIVAAESPVNAEEEFFNE